MPLWSPDNPSYIRGVNIGGWLVMERYITPYTFAITDCHQRGDFCWYPGQIDAPPEDSTNYKRCNITDCNAVLAKNAFGAMDYPLDEWHLSAAFESNKQVAEEWFNSHFDNFLKREDLVKIKEAGITHVRVPLPHWIRGDITEDEPWIAADRWKYFVRMCDWAREIGLQVWPNIHTAPGSQNGFDNSGVQNTMKTCGGWNDDPRHIQRSLDVLLEVAVAIKESDLVDVVTGFGLLNEPFGDCNFFRYKKFLYDGITIVRRILGPDIGIYMSDLFQAARFGDGEWGLDPEMFNNTFLDSHYYNIFAPAVRTMSPPEHIEHVCHPHVGENIYDCCYDDAPLNKTPSHGVQRIVSEWSAAYDSMPGEVLKPVMKSIYEYGEAVLMNRTIDKERQNFLQKFIEAQIVSYEAADMGFGHGWFFWTLKTEGGAFAEWDFMRAVDEGWFPPIASPDIPSVEVYGSCMDIYNRTWEGMEIVHTYPWGDRAYWRGPLENETDTLGEEENEYPGHETVNVKPSHGGNWQIQLLIVAILALALYAWRRYSRYRNNRKWEYTELQT